MDRGSQLDEDDEDDEDDKDDKDDKEDEEDEEERRRRRTRQEEATDIKSNNPHLAGGEKLFIQKQSNVANPTINYHNMTLQTSMRGKNSPEMAGMIGYHIKCNLFVAHVLFSGSGSPSQTKSFSSASRCRMPLHFQSFRHLIPSG